MKQWKKTQEGVYAFLVNEQQIGTMDITQSTMERIAFVTLQDLTFTLKRTGFWKSSISITDQNETAIAAIYPTKWYANSYTLEYNNKKYTVSVRNNPLAEWVISEGEHRLLAYGLETVDGKIAVKITSPEATDHFFDALLWYLFLPIATENSGDDVAFLMLIA